MSTYWFLVDCVMRELGVSELEAMRLLKERKVEYDYTPAIIENVRLVINK